MPVSATQKLIIHIGLPKTATTTLQEHLFPTYKGFLGRSHSGQNARRYLELAGIHEKFSCGYSWQRELARWAGEPPVDGMPVQIISDEIFSQWTSPRHPFSSSWPIEHRPGDRPRLGSHPITEFLQCLKDSLHPSVDLHTVVTLRNQVDFLASLSAQRGVGDVRQILRAAREADGFLNFHDLVSALRAIAGPEKHLTLFFEDGLESNWTRFQRFVGQGPEQNSEETGSLPSANQRRHSDDTWRVAPTSTTRGYRLSRLYWLTVRYVPQAKRILDSASRRWWGRRRVGSSNPSLIEVSAADRRFVISHCSDSNKGLGRLLSRDLKDLGYW